MTANVPTPAHFRLGPSVQERTANCHGWISQAEKAPVKRASKYACEGTLAHHLAAEQLHLHFDGKQPSHSHAVGTKYWVSKCDEGKIFTKNPKGTGVDTYGFTITEPMLEAISDYVDYCIEAARGIPRKYIYIETRVHIPSRIGDEKPEWRLGGTTDFAIIKPFDRIIVIDLKFGKGKPVSAYKNKQGMSYALGIWKTCLDDYEREQIETIDIRIVQPRGYKDTITAWGFPAPEIEEFYAEVIYHQVQIVEEGDETLKAGDWCYFCPAAGGMCDAETDYISGGLSIDVSDLSPAKQLPIVADFDIKKLINIVDRRNEIIKFMDNAESLLEDLTAEGKNPYHKFVTTLGNRKWSADEAATAKALAKMTNFDLYVEKFVTPTQAQDLLYAQSKKDGDSLTKKQCKDIIDELTEQPITGRKLVRKEDESVDANELIVTDVTNEY